MTLDVSCFFIVRRAVYCRGMVDMRGCESLQKPLSLPLSGEYLSRLPPDKEDLRGLAARLIVIMAVFRCSLSKYSKRKGLKRRLRLHLKIISHIWRPLGTRLNCFINRLRLTLALSLWLQTLNAAKLGSYLVPHFAEARRGRQSETAQPV